MEMTTYTIDATRKRLGRVASDAASALAGKKSATYRRGTMPGVRVTITSVAKMDLPTKKREDKIYTHYTHYPGGLKKTTMQALIDKKGRQEVVRKAVYGMLPRTKLRPQMMKLLTIKD